MVPWAVKQKFKYSMVFTAIVLVILAFPAYIIISQYFYVAPSCTDGKQNQGEEGIDCGGVCQVTCQSDINDLTIVWSRIFKVDEGTYDAVAFLENPNTTVGMNKFKYSFKVMDRSGKVLSERKSSTYVNRRESFVVFEPNIRIAENEKPETALFSFDEGQKWQEARFPSDLPILVQEKRLSDLAEHPKLEVVLRNTNELQAYTNLDVVGLVNDLKGNVIAAAYTSIDRIPESSEVNAFFSWNIPFPGAKNVSCSNPDVTSIKYTYPTDVMLVFDRSGSMNDDGGNPPQPITNAKRAARVFIDRMQDVDQVGLVSFATDASSPIDQRLTTDKDAVKGMVDRISIGTPDNEQHTNLGAGIREAARELNSLRHNKGAKKAMVILTDGITTRPLNPDDPTDDEIYPQLYARGQAEGARLDDIVIYVVGLGDKINTQFLQTVVASTDKGFYHAATSNQLKGIYTDIAQAVCEQTVYTAKVFVRQNTFLYGSFSGI